MACDVALTSGREKQEIHFFETLFVPLFLSMVLGARVTITDSMKRAK